MAKPHYDEDVATKNGSAFRDFDSAEIAHHISPEVIESGDVKLIKTDKIAFKVNLSSFNRKFIDVDLCKSLSQKEETYPSTDAIKQLAFAFADEKSVVVWLDIHNAPIFVTTSNEVILLDTQLYDDAQDLTEELLVEFTNSADFKVEEWFLVSSDFQVWYIRSKLGLSKLFIPFMSDWFDKNWPGLMVEKDHEESHKISKLGFRTLLQMYILETGAFLNTTSETFPADEQFAISIPRLTESSLNGGLILADKQVKQLKHMLPKQTETGKKDQSSFDETVINNPKDISVAFDEHKNVTWGVFTSAMEMFPIGCSIFFGPNQVVLDAEERLVFSTSEVELIIYHGPDFLIVDKRNTIDVVCSGDSIDNNLRTRIVEYFDEQFDLSLATIRLATGRKVPQELLL
jgi:hypothetical protein